MIKRHAISIQNAYKGITYAFKTQANYLTHWFLSIIALLASWILKITHEEFLVICTLIVVGLVLETVNTAIELTADAITKEHSEEIRIVKDVSAGAMLIFSIGAVVIAALIFIPKILH